MAINKNFVVKNGLEVSTDLILANASNRRVGIGSTIPTFTLDVRGGIGATNSYVIGISTVLNELRIGVGGSVFSVIAGPTGYGQSVGVGTTNPSYLLDVKSPVSTGQTALYVTGDSRITGDANIQSNLVVSGVSTLSVNSSSDALKITQTGSGNALLIEDEVSTDATPFVVTGVGSVGIGTTNPFYLLDVHSPVSTGQTALYVYGDVRITGDLAVDDLTFDDATVQDLRVQETLFVGADGGAGIATIKQLNISGLTTTNELIAYGISTFRSYGQFIDNTSLYFGDGADLNIYHDGSNSYIQEQGAGNLYVQSNGGSVNIRTNSTENAFVANQDGSVELYYDNAKKFETLGAGGTITGTLFTNQLSVSGVSTFNGTINFNSANISGDLTFANANGDIYLKDNGVINFGDSNDLQIFHNGTVSVIRDGGTGGLQIDSDNEIKLAKNGTGNDTLAIFTPDGSVELYYDNAKKFETLSIGATVTGTLFTNQLSSSGVATANAYYVDGTQVISSARQLQNIVSLDATTTATIEAAIANAPNTFTDIRVSGVSTFVGLATFNSGLQVVSGITTLGVTTATNVTAQNLFVSGIGTVTTLNSTSGTITNLSGTIGTVTTLNSTSGTITNLSGTIGTITTLNSTSGTITNLSGTIGTITTLNSTSGTITNLSGTIGTITNLSGTIGTITTLNSTSGTITNLSGTNVNYTGISTLTNVRSTTLVNTGVSTLGTVQISSGIVTAASGIVTYYGDGSYLTGNARNLTATIGIGTTGAVVGYGVSFIQFAGPGVSTVYYNSNTGIATVNITGGGSGSASIGIGSTPGDAFVGVVTAGNLWYNTNLGRLFIYYQDTDSAQWVDAAPFNIGIVTSLITSLTLATQTASNPSLSFIGDTTTGLFSPGTGQQTFVSAGASVLNINAGGIRVTGVATATDFDALSDIRYKENITTVDSALSKVDQLRGVKFDWKESGLPSYGVIAQELEEVLPELVHGNDPKTVNYNGIIGVLIEAIKELKAEVEELKKDK